jgi:hypothetical protein
MNEQPRNPGRHDSVPTARANRRRASASSPVAYLERQAAWERQALDFRDPGALDDLVRAHRADPLRVEQLGRRVEDAVVGGRAARCGGAHRAICFRVRSG